MSAVANTVAIFSPSPGPGITLDAGSISHTAASGAFTGGPPDIDAGPGISLEDALWTIESGWPTGPNLTSGASGLNALIPGFSGYEDAVLEFDLNTSPGSVYFNHAHPSEERHEYADYGVSGLFSTAPAPPL